ncbi:MAG: hypothetical protein JNG88_17575 [Phycisphaerales bacterium]|nr:hypothetical protein [Phycisphaerales bacterium]
MNWEENKRKSRETLGAAGRQGLHELGAALYGPGTVAQPPEYGGIGTKTPGEVQQGRSAEADRGDSQRTLDERVQQAEAERDAQTGRDARDMDRG